MSFAFVCYRQYEILRRTADTGYARSKFLFLVFNLCIVAINVFVFLGGLIDAGWTKEMFHHLTIRNMLIGMEIFIFILSLISLYTYYGKLADK